jgi:two-component system chemotaxis response regulator CheY
MKKALIVDDALTVRLYHRRLLEEAGFHVEEASNGIEALEKAFHTPFDLFLVDVNMPKMDGYRLLNELRRNQELQTIPAIMISTESAPKDRKQALLAGANTYVVKPADGVRLQLQAKLLAGINLT